MTRPPPPRQTDAGVTLIEMMVVLVIVALMAGLAISGLTPGSAQRKLSGAADVLVQRLALASDEAMVTGRPFGFTPVPGGYRFVVWQGDAGWLQVADGPLAGDTLLSDGMQIAAFSQDGSDDAAVLRSLIAPGGDAPGFRVELRSGGERRLVVFDGLNAREIDAGAEGGDDI